MNENTNTPRIEIASLCNSRNIKNENTKRIKDTISGQSKEKDIGSNSKDD